MRSLRISRHLANLLRTVLVLAVVCPHQSPAQDVPPPPDPAKVKEARDKTAKLNDDINNSTAALNRATTSPPELKSLTDPSSDKGGFLSRLQALDVALQYIVNSKLLQELTDRDKAIQDDSKALTDFGCDKAVLGDNVASDCARAITNAQARASALEASQTNLADALNGVGPYIKVGIEDPGRQLDGLDKTWTTPDELAPEDFAASVPIYKESCGISTQLPPVKNSIYASLTTLKADTSTSGDVKSAMDALAAKLKTEAGKVDAILAAFQKTADTTTKKVSDAIVAVTATPVASGQVASDTATEASKNSRGLTKALAAWSDLENSIKSCEKDSSHLAKLRAANKATQDSKAKLQEKLSLLNDALVGDPNQFTEDAVPLFFYTEVEKLMRTLNERTDWAGGSGAAATVAASQRELLLDAESRVAQARGDVADLQFELAKLQEQQRQADAAISNLALFSQKAGLVKKQRDSDLSRATDEFDKAQKESDADPTNAGKKLQLEKATEKKNTATTKASDATTKDSDARTKLSDAQAQQTASSADKDSLASRIDLAKAKLGDAQRNMEEMQRSAYRAALTESDAFAAARDQTPYLEGPALSTSPDPVKRVIMRGYPDRNLILLRGKPEDIAVVKRVIAAFDVPAPQARLTLWSFEISAEVSKGFLWFRKPVDNLNKATAIVDDYLGKTRSQIADAKTAFHEAVNEEVSAEETGQGGSDDACTIANLSLAMLRDLKPSEQARWRRFRFYAPAVLVQAGVNLWDVESFRAAVLPDPAATTTVGEAMMILELSCAKNRRNVYNKFQSRTAKPFKETGQVLQVSVEPKRSEAQREPAQGDSEGTGDCSDELKKCQTSLKAACETSSSEDSCPGPTVDPESGTQLKKLSPLSIPEGITDTQLEIVRALRAGATRKVLRDLQRFRDQILKLEKDYRDFKTQRSRKALTSSDVDACALMVSEIESLYRRYNRIVNTRFRVLYPIEYRDFQLIPNRTDFAIHVNLQASETWQKIAETGSRVAAADEMLKGIMGRLEDDLDHEYIQQMLKDVRGELVKQGLTVGIVQRTSLLATNRLKARVDPKGMYDLSVGEQQDLLASIGQLASIALTAQTGGALAAFGSLNSLNQKQEQRIYGVTTGNKFEVTPIFDPSGQALRFKFDYVSNSLVRNPKGTVDPSVPSIRHTVNTEVQLSNLEIREISRYESNAKLGIPTRYYGGIPILTDIPGLKPIPLIGWFVRRAGSNAEVQQSVIFGQTTIYPTIGSIVDLLQTGN